MGVFLGFEKLKTKIYKILISVYEIRPEKEVLQVKTGDSRS